jgi:hypothetical protein
MKWSHLGTWVRRFEDRAKGQALNDGNIDLTFGKTTCSPAVPSLEGHLE